MLRTAVIGLGRIGWSYHVPQIVAHEKLSLCAVVDTSTDRLAEAKEKYGVEGYTDMMEMISAAKPNLVVICTPTHLHAAQSIAAMEAGVDVFLDKPMAKDLSECHAIQEAMERTGRKLMVYQPHRVMPETVALKAVLAENLIGDVYMYKRYVSNYVRRNDWQAMLKYGGGMLNNYGAHYIDQALYLLGSDEEAENIHCIRYRMASLGDADDVVKIVIETKSRKTIDVDINQATKASLPLFVIYGRYGNIIHTRLSDGRPGFKVDYLQPEELKKISLSEDLAAAGRKYAPDAAAELPWKVKEFAVADFSKVNFYDYCYEYFSQGKESFIPVEQTIHLMSIIDTCRNQSDIFA